MPKDWTGSKCPECDGEMIVAQDLANRQVMQCNKCGLFTECICQYSDRIHLSKILLVGDNVLVCCKRIGTFTLGKIDIGD